MAQKYTKKVLTPVPGIRNAPDQKSMQLEHKNIDPIHPIVKKV
jgi:hypothetical protein